jgi:hypothetical protein
MSISRCSPFREHLAVCSRNLSLGVLESALAAASEAVRTARTGEERAAAAVMHIQCLEEVHRSNEALEVAVAATASDKYTALTNDLVLTAASLALLKGARDDCRHMLESWLTTRLDDDPEERTRECQSPSVCDAEVARFYILRCVYPEFGAVRATQELARVAGLVSQEESGDMRDEIQEARNRTENRDRAEALMTSRSLAYAIFRGLLLRLEACEGVLRNVGLRKGAWLWGRSDADAKLVAVAATAAVAVWFLGRARSRGPVLLQLLTSSMKDTLKIALGSSIRRWPR